MKRPALLVIQLFLIVAPALSQSQDSTLNWEILNMPLSELMNMKISVTSRKSLPLKESPGIVTVINEADILNSGARDLVDILRLVPGIDFGAEWDDILGIGVRGNNATEGKYLVIIDGHQMNETNFGIFPFGQHILAGDIKRVEVIRGPGSVVYGGSAELAVINIITRSGSDLNGVMVSSDYGISEGGFSRMNLQSALGRRWDNGLEVSVAAYQGISNRSNRTITTLDTTTISYGDSSRIRTTNVNLNLSYRSLNYRFLYDNYLSQNTEASGDILFETFSSILTYRMKLGDKMSLSPLISWKRQKPWYFIDYNTKEFYNTSNDRLTGSLGLSWDPGTNTSVYFGFESYSDRSRKVNDTVRFVSTDDNSLAYSVLATYGEVLYNSPFVNLAAGARYEHHSRYGSAFVPRIAVTKAFRKVHFKLLFSNAFKAPTIANIDINPAIKAERTTVYEIEAGYQFTDNMNIIVNVFDMQIRNPIVFVPKPDTREDNYLNFERSGTSGIEATYKLKFSGGSTSIAYSFYRKNDNTVPLYNVDGKSNTYGGFPQHRASMLSKVSLTKNMDVNAVINLYGRRYTYVHSDKAWSGAEAVTYDPTAVIDIVLNYNDLLVKGMNATLGVYDITNRRYEFINAYRGMQNPIPAMGRELFLRLSYSFRTD